MLDAYKFEAEKARTELQQYLYGNVCLTPSCWQHPSTAGRFLDVYDITREYIGDAQLLLDLAIDKAYCGGSKIGIGLDATGMNHHSCEGNEG